MADHPGRSRGSFRCAVIWRAKPARTTGTCALPFQRDRAMTSDTIAKLCSPADQSDSLVSVLRIF
jgi:hypothetical protein